MAHIRLHERRANADSCATCGVGEQLGNKLLCDRGGAFGISRNVLSPPFHCLLVAVRCLSFIYPLFGLVAIHVFTAEEVENRKTLSR